MDWGKPSDNKKKDAEENSAEKEALEMIVSQEEVDCDVIKHNLSTFPVRLNKTDLRSLHDHSTEQNFDISIPSWLVLMLTSATFKQFNGPLLRSTLTCPAALSLQQESKDEGAV